jgi:hypothetical protein
MIILKKINITKKFGKLRIKIPQKVSFGSHKKVAWVCDCGKEIYAIVYNVTRGYSKSCGHCNEISKAESEHRKFGHLKVKIPQNLSSSNKKILWICDCGREKLINIHSVISGITVRCGYCNEISAEEIKNRKFGKLRIKEPQDILPGSDKKVAWTCDCGGETLATPANVIANKNSPVRSCGKCNLITAEEIKDKKFGKLHIKEPQNLLPKSEKKVTWICDCGNEKLIRIHNVISGHTKSCGMCKDKVYDWYLNNKHILNTIFKSNICEFPKDLIIPLEEIKNTVIPFKAICPLCGDIYYPRVSDIKRGLSLTCGCSTNRVSFGQRQVADFIEHIGFKTELEYSVKKFKYDIFVPSKNLLIEYDGTRWHSMPNSVRRDKFKERQAVENGYEFLRVKEKDWVSNNEETKLYLRNSLMCDH